MTALTSRFDSPGATTIRVLIADDHGVVAEGLRYLIQAQLDMEVIACVSGGPDAVRGALKASPEIGLMDNAMPGLNGTQATHLICERQSDTRAIMLSMYSAPVNTCL